MTTEGRQSPVRQLLEEAIRHLIADAGRSGNILHAGQEALRLANVYPGSGGSHILRSCRILSSSSDT